MTDITYQTTTIGIADQSALLSRITAWCTHFAEGVREGQELPRDTAHYRGFRPRISPGAALTVRRSREPRSPAIEAFRPDFC